MSGAASPPVVAAPDVANAPADRPMPMVPRDRVLPILVALSLTVHATIFLPTFLRRSEAERPAPHEIPVELVQLPPPRPEKKTETPKQNPAKAPAKSAEQKPPPKVAERPKPAAKQAQAKTVQAKTAQKSVAERMKDLLGPMPALAIPASAADGTEAASYSQLVLSKLAKAKKEGRYQGMPAAASVSFTLGDAGEVAHVEIVRPSGDPSLDEEAIAMVKRGAPYPPPPPGGRRDYTITLRFQTLT